MLVSLPWWARTVKLPARAVAVPAEALSLVVKAATEPTPAASTVAAAMAERMVFMVFPPREAATFAAAEKVGT
jgi:hypothetical protein